MGMARLLRKWWPAPLLPLSYFAASRLTRPDSTSLPDPNLSHTQTVTKEHFKKGHLMNEFVRFIHCKDAHQNAQLQLSIVRYKGRLPGHLFRPNFVEERERLLAMTPLRERILTYLRHSGYELRSRPWPVLVPFLMPFIVYLACPCNDPVLGSVDVLEDILKLGSFSYFAAQKFWHAWHVSTSSRSCEEENKDTSGLAIKSIIIGKRNEVAIKELKSAIKRGEHSMAILYGAAHMPDFHKRLTEEFNMVPTSIDWITAWSVDKGPKSKYIQPFLNKFASNERTLFLASLIFATLIVETLAWKGASRYWHCLMLIRFLIFLTY